MTIGNAISRALCILLASCPLALLATGAAANVRIKSGGNTFAGSAFGYHDNEGMKARPCFLPATEDKPKALQNQFGGTLGGPIIANRMFFFMSYEGTHDSLTANRFGTVPTAAMRAGDLSGSPNPIYDPLSGNPDGSNRTPFPGNIIPAARLDPTVERLIAGLPLPTIDRLADNYFVTAPFTFTRSKVDTKVNVNPRPDFTFSGRLGWMNHEYDSPPMFGDLGGLPVHAASGKMGLGTGNTVTVTGSASYIPRANLVVDTYTGVTLIKINSDVPRMDENLGLDVLGIPGTNGSDPLYGSWPQFAVTDFSPIGSTGGNGTPYIDDNWQYQYTTNATWTLGRHTLGFGGDIYFPMGTRTTRGLERYDFEANQMLICGQGGIPTDCGYEVQMTNFSPRLGLAYRVTDALVLRGGYGINYDPYPLAFVRNILGDYPSSIGLAVVAPNSFQYASTLASGIPAIHVPMDLNAGQVPGAGNAGRRLFQAFGRTAHSGLLTNVDWNRYDSLQASLRRRLAQGVQVNVAYTWSKSFGICCDTLSDNPPQIQATEYFDLNRARLNFDRPHNLQTSFVVELPFGESRQVATASTSDSSASDCGSASEPGAR